MFIKKAGRCYWGKPTCFCNRYIDHLWLVSAPLRTKRGEGGGFHEEERVSEQEAQLGPAAWTLSRVPQGHGRDSSWPLCLPARRLLLCLGFLCPNFTSGFLWDGTRGAQGLSAARGRGYEPPRQPSFPSGACVLYPARAELKPSGRPPISLQSKLPPRPLGQ